MGFDAEGQKGRPMSQKIRSKSPERFGHFVRPLFMNERPNDAPIKPLICKAFSLNDCPERLPERSVVRGFSSLKEETRTNAGRTVVNMLPENLHDLVFELATMSARLSEIASAFGISEAADLSEGTRATVARTESGAV
jgi:hypothetical protein